MDDTQAFEQTCSLAYLNSLTRKNWREIVHHFCRFGRTKVVNLAKGLGVPNLNLTDH